MGGGGRLALLATLSALLLFQLSVAATGDESFDLDDILRQVRNLRLTILVESNADLTKIAETAVFHFQFTERRRAPVFFFFPEVKDPLEFRGLWVNGQELAVSALQVKPHPLYDTTVFLLPARYLPETTRPISLKVEGPFRANPKPHYTHWGGWHAYLLSRTRPVPVEMEVHVPSSWDVVCSGQMVRENENGGRKVAVWHSNRPQGWMFLTIGHYRHQDIDMRGTPFTVWWPKDQKGFDPELVTKQPLDILAFYRQEFGAPSPTMAALIEIPEDDLNNFTVNGLVVITRGSYAEIQRNPDYLEGLLAHELAHFWWGDTVNPKGAGLRWLSEGLAEYSRFLYEAARGLVPLSWAHRNLVMLNQFADAPPPALTGPETYGEDQTVLYMKGPFVLKMFGEVAGSDVLRKVLSSFAERYHGKEASVGDLVLVANSVSGDNYDWFFDQWLNRRTGPLLSLEDVGAVAGGEGFVVSGTVVQKGELYRLRVPLQICFAGKDCEVHVLEVRDPRTQFRFNTVMAPSRIRLDPDTTVFKWFPKSVIPIDLVRVYAGLKKTPGVMLVGGPSFFRGPEQESRFCQWLERTLGAVVKPVSDNRILLGEVAAEYRRTHSVPSGDEILPPKTLRVFAARNPEAADSFVLGIEGEAPPDWSQVVIPKAFHPSVELREGETVREYPAAFPKIEFRWPVPISP